MISKIIIKNFKSIHDMTLNCNNKFNVIIGENNIGKTTIFEAIHLWKMCYISNVKKDKMGVYSTAKNLPFKDLECIRVYKDMDLYPVGCSKKDAIIKITLVINYKKIDYKLGFKITKVYSIDDAYLQIDYINKFDFIEFAKVVAKEGKRLDSFITVNETRPVANIVAKEPYMYKAQVLDKIAKGKGYEVLRNKLREKAGEVQEHINNILQTDYVISEIDAINKDYITMCVDKKNILSFGSGFLQLVEIFSSIEYLDSEIVILLIDEPDAHLHLKIQKRLLNELKLFSNAQVFVITHNERFLEYVQEDQILFIDEGKKVGGEVYPLPEGCKSIVLENLSGCLENVDKLRFAQKLIFVEGDGDIDFLEKMRPLYEKFTGISKPNNILLKLDGIDTLNAKLITYARVLKTIIPNECDWLVIRDTDCVPLSKIIVAGNDDIKNVDVANGNISIVFQNGYGIESTFLSNTDQFSRLICKYYNVNSDNTADVKRIVIKLNEMYVEDVKNITSNTYQSWIQNFERQKASRSGRAYKKLEPYDTLKEITQDTVQYIMTKRIMDNYLKDLYNEIFTLCGNSNKRYLTHSSIFDFYYSQIETIDDIYVEHIELLKHLYE